MPATQHRYKPCRLGSVRPRRELQTRCSRCSSRPLRSRRKERFRSAAASLFDVLRSRDSDNTLSRRGTALCESGRPSYLMQRVLRALSRVLHLPLRYTPDGCKASRKLNFTMAIAQEISLCTASSKYYWVVP